MKVLRLFFVIWLGSGLSAFGQTNDYFKLKDVKSFRFDHLLLENDKAAAQFVKNTVEYNYIEALKIDNVSQLNLTLNVINQCYGLKELNLIDYRGDFNEQTFDSASDIEILHITISEEKLEQLKFINKIGKLHTLYLYILGKPENTDAIKSLPQLRELHIIGDFLPADLTSILSHVSQQRLLNVLGISLDRVTDLPESVTKFKMLSKLILYDNLSVFTNKGIDDLGEEKVSIMFDLFSDAISAIAISYFSNTGNLSEFEIEFLQKLYKGEIIPQQFESSEQIADDGFTIPFKKEFQPDFPKSPEFNSPYPSIRPNEEQFIINPNQNNVIHAQSGMKLSIAANSFVNELGETIHDPVYIKLTQIINPQDILFAGLNMAQTQSHFNNKFIFNVQASAEKSSAKLKEGYQIKVYLPTATDSAQAHFFDYESNTWQNLNLYNQVFENNFVPIDFYKLENNSSTGQVYLFDTSSFHTRFASQHALFLNDKDNLSQLIFRKKTFFTDLDRSWTKTYNSSGKLNGIKIKKGKSLVKILKVIPKVRNKSRQYFKVIDRSGVQLFPELKAFKNINFNVAINPDNKREFNDNFIKNIKYTDVRIKYERGRDYCTIVLKTIDGYRKIKAFITDTENKDLIKKQLKKFEKSYLKYNRVLGKRQNEFDELNNQRFKEYKEYTEDRIKNLVKNGQYPELKIHQLGTFGFFYNALAEFNTNLIAQYTDLRGLPIDIKSIFMIDIRYNTVFKISVGNLSLDPSNTAYIIATDYSGNLYYANKDDILSSSLSNNSLTYIKLKKVPANITTIFAFINLIKN